MEEISTDPGFEPISDTETDQDTTEPESVSAEDTASDETRAPEQEGMGGNPSDPSKPPIEQPPTKEQY